MDKLTCKWFKESNELGGRIRKCGSVSVAGCREQSKEKEEENVQGFFFKEEEERSKGVRFTFKGFFL